MNSKNIFTFSVPFFIKELQSFKIAALFLKRPVYNSDKKLKTEN